MKAPFYTYFALWMLFGPGLACTKEPKLRGSAALTVVNAVTGSDPFLIPIFGGDTLATYTGAYQLPYGATFLTGNYTGKQKLTFYQYPDTGKHSTPLYHLDINLPAGTIHTLFLTGTTSSPDTLFTTDVIPYHPSSDSSVGIRFVNLMAGSGPVSVNVAGAAQGSEISSLGYKGITPFTNYPATAAVSDYTFEFHDAASGTLIGTYLLSGVNDVISNSRRFRNLTLALIGTPGDPATQRIILIEAYTLY
jgi:hypothetical protein